ncbi:MAG: type II toxin-antitoxin system Phd/YefM family antitoxin [Marmoricola sp.]
MGEEVVITRAGHDPVVIVSLDEYESLKETAYLLRSPENARRLLSSIAGLKPADGASETRPNEACVGPGPVMPPPHP